MRFLPGIILIITLGCCLQVSAQNNAYSKAHRLFFEGKYEKAIPAYEKALRRGIHPISMERLADCYREIGDSRKAEKWYQKAIKVGRNNTSTQLHYGRMLHANGKYEEAAEQYESYMNETRDYPTVANDFRSCKLALYLKRQPSPYTVASIKPLNTIGSELVGDNPKGKLYFATKGKHGKLDKPQKSTNKSDNYDLVMVTRKGRRNFQKLEKVKGKVNTRADEFGVSFSPTGDSVVFTRTFEFKQGRNRPPLRINRIYLAETKKGKWVNVRPAPFNGPESVSNYHASFHPTRGGVVFASTRNGGMGGSDLWVSRITNGKWSKPENLGTEINTTGDEMWPFVLEDGSLSFASNGHPGLGGLDLFLADWGKVDWKNPQNMGAGINTSKNEQAIAWEADGASGYFSSGRIFAKRDDIYYFDKLPTIDGVIRDSLSLHIQPGVKLTLSDGKSGEQETETNQEGSFTFFGEIGKTYNLRLEAPGYKTVAYPIKVDSSNLKQGHFIELKIPPQMVYQLQGTVMDSETEDLLPNVRIEVIPKGRGAKRVYSANSTGKYKFRIISPGDYKVVYSREGYASQAIDFSLSDQNGASEQEFDISLDWDRETPIAAINRSVFSGSAGGLEGIRVSPGGEFREGNRSRILHLAGKVFEKGKAQTTMEQTRIDVVNLSTQESMDSVYTRADGTFALTIPSKQGNSYYIVASKDGYFSSGQLLEKPDASSYEVNLDLQEASYGLDSTLMTIYYGYNNSDLDMTTRGALCELGFFMSQNPEAILEIWSFTDSRGARGYNRKLSKRRSEAVIGYIGRQLNLPTNRFNARGFGEDQLLNDCIDGKPCSEADHNINRRTEIKVVN